MTAEKKYLYSDNLIRITENTLYIDGFMLGSKCVPFSRIKTIKMLEPTMWNGKYRIAGTSDLRTWFPSDGLRPSRDMIFVVLMHGKWIRYGFTVEDSAAVKQIFQNMKLPIEDQTI
jgi:hypothetical protein